MKDIRVPIAPGELIDKLTILQLKSEKISDPAKLAHVNHELSLLKETAEQALESTSALIALWDQLYEVNANLWAIEDDIRACDARGNFGPAFIALARAVYETNDRRGEIKKQINVLLGSAIVEEKSYAKHGATA